MEVNKTKSVSDQNMDIEETIQLTEKIGEE